MVSFARGFQVSAQDGGRKFWITLYMLSASETENIEQVIIEQSNFKSSENVWIQMFHRGSLSVVSKSKKLFGEGDVGYGKILETRQILNEGDCKGWQSVKSRINVFMKIREIDT